MTHRTITDPRTGQSFKMVEHYARQVNQRKLGDAAMLKFERKAEKITGCA